MRYTIVPTNVTPDRRRIVRRLNARYYSAKNLGGYNRAGIDVFDADWDNLIILDACRYDEFAARANLPGTTEARISRESNTRGWVRANFAGRILNDTVYVTANGNYAHVRDDIGSRLHAHIGLWQDEFRTGAGSEIAPPTLVTQNVLAAYDEYPQKRLLIHYVQPHYPFIGPTGKDHFDPRDTLYDVACKYDLTSDTIRRAYRENLDIVLSEVERLLTELPGRTVVSADHGELLGERLFPIPMRDYGHPGGIYVDELVEVPWHVVDSGDRKRVVAEPPTDRDSFDEAAVEDHLRDLGYA